MSILDRRLRPVLGLAAAAVIAGCGGAGVQHTQSLVSSATRSGATASPSATLTTTSSTPSATLTTTSATTTHPPEPPPPPAPSPGSLPQTDRLPSAHTAGFRAEMAALWQGVTQNSVHSALPAFFPEAAYAQLKAIADPQGDWTNRLVADYQLDISAAHVLLGGAAASLVGVAVPAAYAHWIPPGTCYNAVGYYEVPNSRVVYRVGSQVRSFGIASMISWRGVWYVIHLGAVVRSAAAGIVDDPSDGPGSPSASSTC